MTSPEQKDGDGRKHPRFRTDTLVWWNRDWEQEPIALVDISAGGMRCEFPGEVHKGDIVSLDFEIPGFSGMITTQCEVIHTAQGEGFYIFAGLLIKEIEGMETDAFIELLHQPSLPEPKNYDSELDILRDEA